MPEYIERDAMRRVLEKASINPRFADEPPAADVEPVRHERWVYGGCSHCGSPWLCNDIGEPVLSPYCPGCGAKMDRTEADHG